MSGVLGVKDGGAGGVSPSLHTRSTEGWGDRRPRPRSGASLTPTGLQALFASGENRHRGCDARQAAASLPRSEMKDSARQGVPHLGEHEAHMQNDAGGVQLMEDHREALAQREGQSSEHRETSLLVASETHITHIMCVMC